MVRGGLTGRPSHYTHHLSRLRSHMANELLFFFWCALKTKRQNQTENRNPFLLLCKVKRNEKKREHILLEGIPSDGGARAVRCDGPLSGRRQKERRRETTRRFGSLSEMSRIEPRRAASRVSLRRIRRRRHLKNLAFKGRDTEYKR